MKRKCPSCDLDISTRDIRAKYCSMKCKKAHAYQRKINNVTVFPLAPREVDSADMDFPALSAVEDTASSGSFYQATILAPTERVN